MFGAIAGGIASALAGGAMSKLFGGGQKAASGGIQGDVLDRKSGSAGMPRPISYAVFCLKKKTPAIQLSRFSWARANDKDCPFQCISGVLWSSVTLRWE